MIADHRANQAPTTARATAAVLREEILALHEDGRYLGSEDELLQRLGVGRPSLRQAARILEHENLLTVRRGVNGGFFSRIPSSEAVTHVASVYLRAQRTTIVELTRAAALVAPEVARLAAAQRDDRLRSEFADFVDSQPATGAGGKFVRANIHEFGVRLTALAANQPLALFYRVLMDLALDRTIVPDELRLFEHRAQVEVTLAYHRRMGSAVRAGDQAAAIRDTHRYYATVETWLAGSRAPR